METRSCDDVEAFAFGGVGEVVVEADEVERCRACFGGDEGRGQLKRVGGPQVVNAEKAFGGFANGFDRFDLVPASREDR